MKSSTYRYGRGGGVVGRGRGVGDGLTAVGVGVGVGVNVAVGVGVRVAVAVAVAVAVGVGVAPPQIPSVSALATVVEPLYPPAAMIGLFPIALPDTNDRGTFMFGEAVQVLLA